MEIFYSEKFPPGIYMDSIFRPVSAVSTARGKGGIAVIRISGEGAVGIASSMFEPMSGKRLDEYGARYSVYGHILGEDGTAVDDGIAVVYRAPASYTGEDMVEISCHGGVAVTEAVYMSTLAHGAYPAGPGEFTRRAFMNGKMSLSEAQAVGLLIDADTSEKMKLSYGAVNGAVSKEIKRISESMTDTMTALYAAIDYPEEDVGDEGEREIYGTLSGALADVERLLGTYRTGRAVCDGVRCVICGRPNVGKSSLFNCMTGDDSAIVTSVAGTTRDILRETVSFAGITLRLSDTAGIHDSEDTVESIGVDRAGREIESAELIIAVFDGSEPLDCDDYALIERLKTASAPVIYVLNKSDKEKKADFTAFENTVFVSASEGDISALEKEVARLFGSDRVNLTKDAVIWDARQREMLLRARNDLDAAVKAIEFGDPVDAVCTLAEEALAALCETDGRGIDEMIVNEIFSRFCVGK